MTSEFDLCVVRFYVNDVGSVVAECQIRVGLRGRLFGRETCKECLISLIDLIAKSRLIAFGTGLVILTDPPF